MSFSRKNMYLGTMHQTSSGLRGIALKSIAGLVLGLGLWDCTSDDMAGGGPSGTEAGNAITATLYDENGSLARYATVTLIKRSSLSGEAYAYTAVADSNGIVSIDSVDVGDYIMEVALEGNAAQIEVSVENTTDTVSLGEHKLQKTVFMSGSLLEYGCENCENAFGTLKFFGLNHATNVTNGMFSIGGLPAGNLNFAFIPNYGPNLDTIVLPTIKAKAGDSIVKEHVVPTPEPPDTTSKDTTKEDTIVKPEGPLETLLLDDFEDGDNIHKMGESIANPLNSSAAWFLYPGDNKMGYGYISIEPKVTTYNNPFVDIIETEEDENRQVHFKVTFPDSLLRAYPLPDSVKDSAFYVNYPGYAYMDSTAWVSQWKNTFGLEIGVMNKAYDLSGVDSIVFEAWGSGSCTFELNDKSPKYATTNAGYNYGYNGFGGYSDPHGLIIGSMEFALPAKKSKVAVAVADLIPDAEKRKNITTISWVFYDDVEFYFDNLEFVGYDLESIWNTK